MSRLFSAFVRSLCGATILAWLAVPAAAQVELNQLEPLVLTRGKENTLTLRGKNLQQPSRLVLPWKAPVRLDPDVAGNGKKGDQVVYRVQVPEQQPVGVYPLLPVTAQGSSSPRLVWVDHLPAVAESPNNHQPQAAQQLSWPVAVSGRTDAEQYDYFRIRLQAGQCVSLQAVAAALGSQADLVLKVFAPSGRELLYVDDTTGGGSDPQTIFTAPEDGTYTIQVHDVRFRGGVGFGYVLRVGRFPVVEGMYPLVLAGGKEQAVQLAGPGLLWQRSYLLPSAKGWWRRQFRADGFPDVAALWLRSSTRAEYRETGPNDARDQVQPLAFPCGVNGWFQSPGDRDYWAFRLQKGKAVVFQGQARQFGSPADLYLRLFDSEGKQLAEVDDTGTEEGRLVFTPPADGVYYLLVEELARQAGPAYSYRVEVSPRVPAVRLLADTLVLNAPRGGVAVVKITAQRDGTNAVVELAVDGPPGLQVQGTQIPQGKKDVLLKITVPSPWSPGTFHRIRIRGKLAGTKETVPVLALTGWQKRFPGIKYPPPPWVDTLGLGIGAPFPKFFQLALAPPPAVVARRGKKPAQLKVTLKRLNKKFQAPVTLQLRGLPPGTKVNGATVPKGKNETTLAISVPAQTPPGVYPLELVARAEFQYQPQQERVSGLLLHVKTEEGLPLIAP